MLRPNLGELKSKPIYQKYIKRLLHFTLLQSLRLVFLILPLF